MNSSEYLSWDAVRKQCILTIIEDAEIKHWVLGLPFLRGYYTVHDMENKRIGLAGKYIDLGEIVLPKPINVPNNNEDEEDWWTGKVMWLAIGITGLIALVIIIGIIYYCCNKEKEPPIRI
jgi:hypothetical protein